MRIHQAVFGVACFVAGGSVGAGVIWGGEQLAASQQPVSTYQGVQVRSGGYQFINPLLECEIAPDVGMQELRPASAVVRQVVDQYFERGIVEDVSIYFRDLNNGPWFGINERELFAPASLFKVPLLVAVLKQAEVDPTVLKQTLVFETPIMEQYAVQNIDPPLSLTIGQVYSVEELLERMIAYSDNEALGLLLNVVSEEELRVVELDLGLVLEEGEDGEQEITVKSYAGIFRILFNASYLNRQMSEKALEILSQSAFKGGIPAKLPSDMVVAHKFGERVTTDLSGVVKKQLHDCGVVYYPERPYLLCVMTRGSDLQQLTKVVRDVSEAIYLDAQRQDSSQ
jgi:beta-lactamase class A